MCRVLLAMIVLSAAPVAFTQSLDVASKSPGRILIKAKCALPDGTVLAHQLFEVDATLSAQEKRAMAERACQPIMDAAVAKCEDLANRVDALKSEWRQAALDSHRERQLVTKMQRARAAAPSYCK